MVFLCSLELGGTHYSPFPQGKVAQFRWGSHLPILTVLALVFIIPHDPSTSLDSWRVGSDAYQARARPARPVKAQRTQLAPARTHLPGASMQASAALLREGIVEEASTAAWASQLLQEVVPATLGEDAGAETGHVGATLDGFAVLRNEPTSTRGLSPAGPAGR